MTPHLPVPSEPKPHRKRAEETETDKKKEKKRNKNKRKGKGKKIILRETKLNLLDPINRYNREFGFSARGGRDAVGAPPFWKTTTTTAVTPVAAEDERRRKKRESPKIFAGAFNPEPRFLVATNRLYMSLCLSVGRLAFSFSAYYY